MSLCVVVFLCYMFPAIVAALRQHQQLNSITIVNFFLGWTFVGWVVSLAWAASAISVTAKATRKP